MLTDTVNPACEIDGPTNVAVIATRTAVQNLKRNMGKLLKGWEP
jgi:hypothetical protein